MTDYSRAIAQLRAFPAQLEALVRPLDTATLLATPLRGEWSVAQNVHHLADSHLHSYMRCKRIATEEYPTIHPYDQDVWAGMSDASMADIDGSLQLLHGLHTRWAHFFSGLATSDWRRAGFHPEVGEITLEMLLDMYVIHGNGHLDQITRTITAQNNA